jgi:uncharacterized coiled-coil DUF342 family protein
MKKAELQAELKRMTSRSDAHLQNYMQMLCRVETLKSELREARSALQRLADCDWVITPHDRMDAVRAIAREALK